MVVMGAGCGWGVDGLWVGLDAGGRWGGRRGRGVFMWEWLLLGEGVVSWTLFLEGGMMGSLLVIVLGGEGGKVSLM